MSDASTAKKLEELRDKGIPVDEEDVGYRWGEWIRKRLLISFIWVLLLVVGAWGVALLIRWAAGPRKITETTTVTTKVVEHPKNPVPPSPSLAPESQAQKSAKRSDEDLKRVQSATEGLKGLLKKGETK